MTCWEEWALHLMLSWATGWLESVSIFIGARFRRVIKECLAMGLGLLLKDGIVQSRLLLGGWLSLAISCETVRGAGTGGGQVFGSRGKKELVVWIAVFGIINIVLTMSWHMTISLLVVA